MNVIEEIAKQKVVEKIVYQINRNENKEDSSNILSLEINETVPSDMIEYGKYLFSHIEKEEKYKIKYLSEVNHINQQIISIFSKRI